MSQKITETKLIENFECLTVGLTFLSKINGREIFWNYRRGSDGEFNSICAPDKANEISLEYERAGTLIKLDDPRPDYSKLRHALNSVIGDRA